MDTAATSDRTEPAQSHISFTGQGSAFAFNFQIPPVTPVEDMETTETPDASSSPGSQKGAQEEMLSLPQEVNSPPELSVQSKAKKKKKKSAKKNPPESNEPKQKPSSAEESQRGEDTELVSVKRFPPKQS